MSNKKWDALRDAQHLLLLDAIAAHPELGTDKAALAAATGVPITRVTAFLGHRGDPVLTSRHQALLDRLDGKTGKADPALAGLAMAQIDDARVIELYVDEGLSLREVSLRTGYSPSGVANALARHGISRRGAGRSVGRTTGKNSIPANSAPSKAGPRRVAPPSDLPTGGSQDRPVDPEAKRDHRAEWFASLRRAQEYIARSGFPRQRDVTTDGWKPGKWIARQKEDWNRLSQEQRDALAALPGFAHDAREAHFDAMVAAYLRARAAGRLEEPFGKRWVFEGYPLGQWLHDLERGRTRLTPERREKLRQAGILH